MVDTQASMDRKNGKGNGKGVSPTIWEAIQSPPTVYQTSGERQGRTVEELFLGCVLYYLWSNKPQDRYKGFKYLKIIPEDAIVDPTIKTLIKALKKTCGSGNGELSKPVEQIMSATIENVQAMGGSIATLTEYYGLGTSPEIVPALMIREFAQEILNLWKKRRIAEYQKLIAEKPHDFETLKKIFDKIREVEEYDPIWEDIRAKEEESLLLEAITAEEVNKEVEWLYPEFISPGTINFWYAPPSQGKTALALAIAVKLLRDNKIDKVLYFDGDNPITVLQRRGLPRLLDEYKGKLYYFRPGNAQEFWEKLRKTKSVAGRVLIILDTLQRLAGRLDINKTTDAIRIMDFFKEIVNDRIDEPATLIVLHHVNKPPVTGNGYTLIERLKGSTTFGDNCDVAYFFTKRNREGDALYVCLENSKDRIPVRPKICFRIEVEKAWLEEVDEVLSEDEQRFVNIVTSFIREFHKTRNEWPTKEEILQYMKTEGFGYHRSRDMLARFEEKYWIRKKDPNTPRGHVYILRSCEDFEDLKICRIESESQPKPEDFEDLKICRNKESQEEEAQPTAESTGQIFKSSNLQNFKSSKLQSCSSRVEEERSSPEVEEVESRPIGIRSDFPNREEQLRLIDEYMKTHDKTPYEEWVEAKKTADCRKCQHYDSEKEVCRKYLNQPVVPNMSAKVCPFYEVIEIKQEVKYEVS